MPKRLPEVFLNDRQLRHRANVGFLKRMAGKVAKSAEFRERKKIPLTEESNAVHILSGVAKNQFALLENEAREASIVAKSTVARQKSINAALRRNLMLIHSKKRSARRLVGYGHKIPLRTVGKVKKLVLKKKVVHRFHPKK